MPPKYRFEEGEKVLCFHGPLIYEAKCLKAQVKEKQIKYFIHYTGWSKNWDEWVPTSHVLKYNEANVQKQKELQRVHEAQMKNNKTASKTQILKRKLDVASRNPDSQTSTLSTDKLIKAKGVPLPTPAAAQEPASNIPRKKRSRLDQTFEAEEEQFCTKVEVEFKIPDELKPWLVQDWDLISRQKKLVKLPVKETVEKVLEDYVKHKTSSKSDTSNKESAIKEAADGIKELFDAMLHSHLLYNFEKFQYVQILEKRPQTSMSKIYGAIHLLRLFVKIGKMLPVVPVDEMSLHVAVMHIDDIFRYLVRNVATLFSKRVYFSSSSEYQRRALIYQGKIIMETYE